MLEHQAGSWQYCYNWFMINSLIGLWADYDGWPRPFPNGGRRATGVPLGGGVPPPGSKQVTAQGKPNSKGCMNGYVATLVEK